ncbi:hypothetical protein BJV78DRAFT_1202605, partial [Lactifluus subvellereus]
MRDFFLWGLLGFICLLDIFHAAQRAVNRVRNAMLAVSVVMYAVSASHWSLEMAITTRRSGVGKVLITPS